MGCRSRAFKCRFFCTPGTRALQHEKSMHRLKRCLEFLSCLHGTGVDGFAAITEGPACTCGCICMSGSGFQASRMWCGKRAVGRLGRRAECLCSARGTAVQSRRHRSNIGTRAHKLSKLRRQGFGRKCVIGQGAMHHGIRLTGMCAYSDKVDAKR